MSRLPKTISVEKLDNSVLFTFAQNQHYLYDGTIEVPFNSLSIIADKSEAITLRKSASNDIFISAPWENFDINASSKEDVVDALVEMLYDEAGISQEEVQDMIDAATSGIPSSQVIEQLRTDVNTISGNVQTLSGEVATKADASDLQALSEKVDTKLDASAYTPVDLSEYWTSAETKSYVDGKVDDALDDYWTSAETQNAINAATSGIPSSQVIEQLRTDVNTISGNVENNYYDKEYIDEKEEVVASALTELNLRLNEDEEVTAAALNDLNSKIGSGGGALFVDYQDLIDNMNDDKWDELVNALQNNKPIFYWYDYSEGDAADAGLTPVDGYVYINETEGSAEIGLKQLYGGGYRELYIVKNGSEDYEVTDDGRDYQPLLHAGSGISIDSNNVISVTSSSISVDSELDETSNNPVANSAITNVIIDDEEVISKAINDLNNRLEVVESGGSVDLSEYWTSAQTKSYVDAATSGGSEAYYISFATLATQGITDDDWDGIVAAIDEHRPIYAGYPRTDGGIIYYGVECMDKNVTNTQIVMTASDASAHYFYTFVKNGSNDYSYTVDTKPYVTQAEKDSWNTVSGKVETSAITSSITSASTNAEVAGAKAVYDAIDAKADASTTYTKTEVNNLVNNKFWCGTQAQYDALATKENDVLYLIHE